MLIIIIESILSFLGELFLQLVTELMLDFGLESIDNSFKKKEKANLFMALGGLAILGVLSGFFISLIFPKRFLPMVNFHGLSIILAAIINGLLMMQYGKWRLSKGSISTVLATFWGGSIFAFSMALVRWMMIENKFVW